MSSPRNSPCAPSPRRTERGSAVITVLVLAAVTAVIASGFLFRSTQEARLATRSYFQTVALNLAEAGIEEGLYAANTATLTTANGWALASGSSTDYVKTITTGFDFQQATGAVYIRVDGTTELNTVVTAAGVITIPRQPSLMKQLRTGADKRRLWSNAMVATDTLTFSGSAVVDSYDSSLGPYNAATNRSDQATIATTSTALDSLVVGSNATIYGYVATGGADPVVGAGGRIYGSTTPGGTAVDPARVRHDFTANLPDVTAPTTTAITLAAINNTLVLPRVGDSPGANGRYLYTTTDVGLNGNNLITVLGPVDLIVTGDVSVTGNGSITVGGAGSTNPSFNLYCPGTISLGGSGMVNSTLTPSKVTIWGTAPSSGAAQTITISGSSNYVGTIYAVNGNVTLSGSGSTNGAVIAKTATVSGSGVFHYDTQLAGAQTSLDTSYRVSAWSELTGSPTGGSAFARDNRAPFNTLF